MVTKGKICLVLCAISCLFLLGTVNAELVGHWEFTGNANDTSGKGNNGTLAGNAAIVNNAQKGQVLSLDGNGDYVDCGNSNSLQTAENLTVALWFNSRQWNSEQNGYNGLISKRDDWYTKLDWEIYYDRNHMELRTTAGANGSSVMFSNQDIYVGTNQWHHLALTKAGTSVNMYIDGILAGSATTNATWTTSSSLRIGTLGLDNLNYGFNGLLDDVRVYNNALTADEVRALVPEPATIMLLGAGILGLIKRKSNG